MLPLLRSRYRSRLALVTAEPDAYAEVHPELARRVGVGSGDQIRLDTRRGSAVLRARISNTIRTTRSCALSRGWAAGRHRLDQPSAGPDLADAGVQGLRGGLQRGAGLRAIQVGLRCERLSMTSGAKGVSCTPGRGSCRATTTSKGRACVNLSRSIPL